MTFQDPNHWADITERCHDLARDPVTVQRQITSRVQLPPFRCHGNLT